MKLEQMTQRNITRHMLTNAVLCILLAALSLLGMRPAVCQATEEDPEAIRIIPQDGFNLVVEENISRTYAVVKLTTPAHNWFAGTFTNLPVDEEVTIGLSMEGMDAGGNPANVAKWQGLVPVMTYADPTKYETYETFVKNNQGYWISTDPFKQGEERFAGRGAVPVQSIIPADVSEQFLSADGNEWCPWREVDSAEPVVNLNILRIRKVFAYPQATVAMRVPFTYTYLQHFIQRLKAKQLPGIYIDEIGKTLEGRNIQVIRVDALQHEPENSAHNTVLVYAREHATENASSWGTFGIMQALLSSFEGAESLNKSISWIIVPIFDPDGSAQGCFNRISDRYSSTIDIDKFPEVLAYSRYIIDYIEGGRSVDMVISLHNVEANETQNVFCPFIDQRCKEMTINFNTLFLRNASQKALTVGDPSKPWDIGLVDSRFNGWCAKHIGSMALAYELNDRYPNNRLSLNKLAMIGQQLVSAIHEWSKSDEGIRSHDQNIAKIKQHQTERRKYFKRQHRLAESHTEAEILLLGY